MLDSQIVNAKEKFLRRGAVKCYSSEHMIDTESLRGLDRWTNQLQDSLKPKLNPEQGPNPLQVC